MSIDSPKNDSTVGSAFDVYWNATDSVSYVEYVRVYLNGSLEAVYVEGVNMTNTHEFSGLSSGYWYNVTIVGIDAAGNSDRDTVYVYVLAISIVIMSPKDGEYFNVSWVVVDWNASGEIDHFEMYVDDQPYDTNISANVSSYNVTDLIDGVHNISVFAVDSAGGRVSDNVTVIIDTVVPVIDIVDPDNSSYFNYSLVEIVWVGSDANMDRYYIRLDEYDWIDVGLNTSYTFNITKEGEHFVYVRAVDKANNSNISVVRFICDYSAPSISILDPKTGEFLNSSSLVVSWNGSDNIGIDHYEIRIDSGSWIDVGSVTSYLISSLDDGNHTIFVRVFDGADHVGMDSVWVVIDTVSPDIDILSPSNSSWHNSSVLNISWTANDVNIDHFMIMCSSNNTWIDMGLSTWARIVLESDGEYYICVKAYDKAGNENISEIVVYVDITAPIISVLAPENNSYVNHTLVIIEWETKYDFSGIDHYEISYNDSWINVGTSNNYTCEISEGKHIIYIKAIDNVGNIKIVVVNITVDITPPIIEILSPSMNETIENNNVTIMWSANDNFGILKYLVKINDENWIDVGTETSLVLEDLDNGEYVIIVKAIDLARNSNSTNVTFTVKYTLGTLYVLFGEQQYLVAYSDPTILSASVCDENDKPIDGVAIVFYVNISGNLVNLGTNTTNVQGIAILRWVADIEPGRYEIYAECLANGYYETTVAKSELIVEEETTIIDLRQEFEVQYTDRIDISCSLYTDDGEPLIGEVVDFYYVDSNDALIFIGSNITKDNGIARIVFDANILVGNYTLVVKYDEDRSTKYKGSESSAMLIIRPEGMEIYNLAIEPQGKIYVDEEVKITFTLGEDDSVFIPVPQADVVVYINNEKIWTGQTDENGKAIFTWVPKATGECKIVITITKQNYEDMTYTIKRTIFGQTVLPIYLPAILASAVMGIIAIVLYKRRKGSEGEEISELFEGELEEIEREAFEEIE